MDAQRAGEGFDRRQQPLLQAGDEQARRRLLALRSRPAAATRGGCGTRPTGPNRRSSGASAGRPSMSICTTLRLGKPPWTSRMSSLRRRTITSSSIRFLTGTPRQNRCGSRISSRAEKLLEWPLCGVAERNRRCSNRGARSRTARVICESMAYFWPLDGRGVVGLVENQQRAAAEVAQPVAQAARRTPRRSAAGARRGIACAYSRG